MPVHTKARLDLIEEVTVFRQGALAAELPALVPGYDRTPEAAVAMLQALRRRGALLNEAMAGRIEALARR